MPTSSSADGGGPQEPFPRAPSLSQVDPSLSFDDFIHKERQSRHVCVWEGRRLRVLAAPTGEWLDATLCILKQTALTTVTPQPVLSPFGLFGFGGGFFPHPIFSAKTDIDINWECEFGHAVAAPFDAEGFRCRLAHASTSAVKRSW